MVFCVAMRPMKPRIFFFLIVAATILVAQVDAQTSTPAKFLEREVTFSGAGGFQLRGTLTSPAGVKGKVPGVLFLSGSGPTDRNGNAPPTVITDLEKQIAE